MYIRQTKLLRKELKNCNQSSSWSRLRDVLSVQQRVTATFKRRDGWTLHIRKSTVAETELQGLYDILNISSTPVGIKKMIA